MLGGPYKMIDTRVLNWSGLESGRPAVISDTRERCTYPGDACTEASELDGEDVDHHRGRRWCWHPWCVPDIRDVVRRLALDSGVLSHANRADAPLGCDGAPLIRNVWTDQAAALQSTVNLAMI